MAREMACSIYRGGNSKSLFFRDEDLPANQEDRDRIFLYAIGSPDPLRVNGLGGTTVNQNKAVIVAKPDSHELDIIYTLGQISLNEPRVEYSYNGGNVTFAVALYAAHCGMVSGASGDEVRIYNTNTREYINAKIMNVDTEPGGAKIKLDFMSPGGNVTGSLFPTGRLIDEITIQATAYRLTVIDAGNLTVLINASELGLEGTETSEPQVSHVFGTLEEIGKAIASQLGVDVSLIKTLIIGRPKTYTTRTSKVINQTDINLCGRDITLRNFHPGFPVTGAIAVSIAALVPGTLANQLANLGDSNGLIRIGSPSGIYEIGASVSNENGQFKAEKITLVDSARAIMRGTVWVP